MSNGSNLEESDGAITQERKFFDLVRRGLLEARRNKYTGKISFTAQLQDGGITNRVMESEIRDK